MVAVVRSHQHQPSLEPCYAALILSSFACYYHKIVLMCPNKIMYCRVLKGPHGKNIVHTLTVGLYQHQLLIYESGKWFHQKHKDRKSVLASSRQANNGLN